MESSRNYFNDSNSDSKYCYKVEQILIGPWSNDENNMKSSRFYEGFQKLIKANWHANCCLGFLQEFLQEFIKEFIKRFLSNLFRKPVGSSPRTPTGIPSKTFSQHFSPNKSKIPPKVSSVIQGFDFFPDFLKNSSRRFHRKSSRNCSKNQQSLVEYDLLLNRFKEVLETEMKSK